MRLSIPYVSEFYSFSVQAVLDSDWQAIIDICRDNRRTPELIHPSVLRAIQARLNRAFWADNEPFILVPKLVDNNFVLIHAKIDAHGMVWAVDPSDCPQPWYTFEPEDFKEALNDSLDMNLSYKHSALERIKNDLKEQDGEVPPLVKIGPGGDYVRVYN
tara:strand:+ start:490 stop:966 length:477 start_codon:yes stop_codon:yes gene_type:complete